MNASSNAGPTTRLTCRSAADLLAAVPYLLGFRPRDSIVAVLLREGVVQLSARSDLAGGSAALAVQLGRVVEAHQPDAVVLVGYGAAGLVDAALSELGRVRPFADRVIDLLAVTDGGWRSLSNGAHGTLDEGARVAAEAVYAGLVALDSRSDAIAAAQAPAPAEFAELRAEADRQSVLLAASTTDRTRLARSLIADDTRRPLSRVEAVRLAVLVSDAAVRERLWTLFERDTAAALVACWARVLSCSPPELQTAPICLLGMAAWLAGQGALVVRCIELAEGLAPDDPLTGMLLTVQERALPPSVWEEVRAAIPT